MILDDAIKHCLEVAENCEEQAKQCESDDRYERHVMHENAKCATDHRQLAEWLKELKDLREENKVLISECDRLIKEKGELNKLKEKAVLDICRREARLKEAKRLLKVAMNDMKILYESGKDEGCVGIEFKWRYTDEALKLLSDEK